MTGSVVQGAGSTTALLISGPAHDSQALGPVGSANRVSGGLHGGKFNASLSPLLPPFSPPLATPPRMLFPSVVLVILRWQNWELGGERKDEKTQGG